VTTPDLTASDATRTARTVQVVAHRGSSHALPEHTLAAYQRALDEGADALECDVRVTADGKLVCVHDRTLRRTSDGGSKVVSTLTLEQLRAYDFGSWKNPEEPEPQPVLTLENLLELVVGAGRRVDLAIETKHPVRFRGQVETELVAMLRRFGIAGAVGPYDADGDRDSQRPHARIMSFSGVALGRLLKDAPEFPRVFLFDKPAMLKLWPGAGLPKEALVAGPGIELVRRRPELIRSLRAAGHRVHVWTVDEPEDVELCLELGVTAIITNRPRAVLDQLGR
jgi:glycerophosphoryl diester phosphodiesterase